MTATSDRELFPNRVSASRLVLGGAALLVLVVGLNGCAMVPWLGGEKDPRPPTPLEKKFSQQLAPNILWKTRIGKGTSGRALNLAPLPRDGRLYVADARGQVAALSQSDGRAIWERDTDLRLSSGPEVVGDLMVLGTSDAELIALSSRDGSQRWRTQLGSEILSTPRIAGDRVIVHTIDDSVYALSTNDGKQLWRYSYPAPVLTLHGSSSPIIVNDNAIVGIAGGRLVSLELERGAPNWELTVTPPSGRSELERIADLDVDPVVVGDIAYVATYNGDLAAVDIVTGSVLWRRELSAYAGLVADRDALFVTDSEDVVWGATTADGSGLWKQDGLKYRRLTAPALVNNHLVVADMDGWLHWIDRNNGRLLARERVAKDRIVHRPVVADGRVFVYANDGTVAALTAGGSARRTSATGAQSAPRSGSQPLINPGPAPSAAAGDL
ncbi:MULTISPECIES: outer membrane protein assembly factor BamB [Thiorhodovibrio]|uniref:outer membrane protein assembly factor BamB n=1 Tax=Thiorhodovibrio TaxID=61593 RepID=UPI00191336F9|nr:MULTISPECIES: outer membrane protein assembly factor BamB [Thiorhodovibrio]MBK5968912.1 outer membrane protein assembly factor BamB [Thiorhodovibrio winogradskyi]WPL14365.1 Outer membrane protein assembly factor BamB precursor [Thiorhodovibrio litoralis]